MKKIDKMDGSHADFPFLFYPDAQKEVMIQAINLHLEYLRICLYTALTALVTSIQSYPMERLLLMRTTARLSRQF